MVTRAKLARAKLLVLYDLGPEPFTAEQARDLLKIVEDHLRRRIAGSVLITARCRSTDGTK